MSDLPEIPWESVGDREVVEPEAPGILVDLRRCIGCHACSVACKTEHGVPLGVFRMRVRWLPRPGERTMAFVPLFDAKRCDLGQNRRRFGMDPACVSACPTEALIFGDRADPDAKISQETARLDARPFVATEAKLREGVVYVGQEAWQADAIHKGCELDPRDEDIIYEQR